MKDFVWMNDKMEDHCVEDSCSMEEMNENMENFESKDKRIDTKTFQKYQACFNSLHGVDDQNKPQKTRDQTQTINDKIRKQCLPSTWSHVGVPIYAAGKMYTFQQIVDMVQYPTEVLKNPVENPFIAEHRAFDILSKVRGLKWPHSPRDRGLFHSDVERECNEDSCEMEEMNEDFENWHGVERYGKKIPTESFLKYQACYKSMVDAGQKTRDKVRKQCLPYEWNIIGLPMNLQDDA